MQHFLLKVSFVSLVAALLLTGCSTQQATKIDMPKHINLEKVQAGQFDTGKMWTFDFPPMEYFAKTYNFTPSKEWFEKARLSALRLPNCTASFVSEDGLVMTNHHCARAALDSVNREGERLAEAGFYAPTLNDERKANNIFIDQLLVMDDVTKEVQEAFDNGTTDNIKIENRMAKMLEIQKRYAATYKTTAPQDSMVFSIVSFYNGGRYSLYGYKRYTDVRLVYAPEDVMAFFGGDPDNFTYPRYDFDCAFFRVYDNGKPLKTANFFPFSQDGAKEGEAVFVIGNPGRTNRLKSVAQLEYLRDVIYPSSIETYEKTASIYSSYIAVHPEAKLKYLNTIFGLENSRKAITGYLSGLVDPVVMAKKRDFERKFQNAILNKPELSRKYGNPWKDIARSQDELTSLYPKFDALRFRGRTFPKYLSLTSDLVNLAMKSHGSISDSAKAKFYPSNLTPEVEKQLLAFRLSMMERALAGNDAAFDNLMAGRTPEQAAEELSATSIIASKEKTQALLNGTPEAILHSTDPLIAFIVAEQAQAKEVQKKYTRITEKLQAGEQILGNAMYDVYGTHIPPDATFTLRIADGVVKGFPYNGTIAPPITTFYGLYDRYYSFGMKDPWKLADRWVNPPATFKMNTPMNFVSTNDITGGNSGSPAININLQIVGLIFDGNMESLPGDIIFDDSSNRSVSVHSSGLLEGLEQIYKAERIVKELRAGKIVQ
ncbi:MAG: S46 family peptidase [Ignavibacteriae bacterium]|nr:MAG: S46 family peptidase [Ignavibacteriota bacterium]